jgi:hypothetical protein
MNLLYIVFIIVISVVLFFFLHKIIKYVADEDEKEENNNVSLKPSIIINDKYKYINSFDEINKDYSFYCMPCMALFNYLVPVRYEGMGPENLPEVTIQQKVEKSLEIKWFKCNNKGYAITIIDQDNTTLVTVCQDLYGGQINGRLFFMIVFFETLNNFPENIDLLQSGYDFKSKYPEIIIPNPEELLHNIQIIKQKYIYNTRKQ